jgi:DNA-binding transcriptional ArsR family regulator
MALKTAFYPDFHQSDPNAKKVLRNHSVACIFETDRLHFNGRPEGKRMRRDIFQAIADPTRRAIVLLLAVQAMTPNAMAEHFDTSRQAVSKHIKILLECDLLEQRQQGREIQYHLKAARMHEFEKWLEQFKALMTKRFTQLDDVLTRMKEKKK